MAYDKIIPIRQRLDRCIDYVLNPEKTDLCRVLDYIGDNSKNLTPDGKTALETAIHCHLETAHREMRATKERWSKPGGVLGYHLVHSYAPGEVTPEQAHTLGVEFARKLLQDRYEAVVSTHLDREHIHCHIVFNSVSFMDGKKFRDNFKAYYGDIRGISNAVSRGNGLSVIDPTGGGKSYAQWDAEQKGKATVRDLVRQDIDAALVAAFTYQSFLTRLRKQGYEIKTGPNVKHTAVKPPGCPRYIRLSGLGTGYTEEDIRKRLSEQRTGTMPSPVIPEQSKPRRYTVRKWSIQPSRKKLTGFQRLYVHYLLFLGVWKPSKKRKYVPIAVRKEVTRLNRYQKQFRLLREYRIESSGQLSMLKDAIQSEMDVLTDRRKSLYLERRKGAEVSGQIDAITRSLRQLQQKKKLCEQIESDAPRIREQVSVCQKSEKEESKKQTRKFTLYERSS